MDRCSTHYRYTFGDQIRENPGCLESSLSVLGSTYDTSQDAPPST